MDIKLLMLGFLLLMASGIFAGQACADCTYPTGDGILLVLFLGLIAIMIVCAYLSINIGEQHWPISMMFLFITLICLITLIGMGTIAVQIMNGTNTWDSIESFYTQGWLTWIVYVPYIVLIYFIIMLLWKLQKNMMDTKEKEFD